MYSYGVNYACYLRWNLMTLFMQLASLIQWNQSRGFRWVFFETLYFSNQKSFSLDLLGFVHDFSNPRFLEIPDGILRTNSASFQKFALDFSNLKIREPRKTAWSYPNVLLVMPLKGSWEPQGVFRSSVHFLGQKTWHIHHLSHKGATTSFDTQSRVISDITEQSFGVK